MLTEVNRNAKRRTNVETLSAKKLDIRMECPRLGLSIIDNTPTELCYVLIKGVKMKAASSHHAEKVCNLCVSVAKFSIILLLLGSFNSQFGRSS